MVILKKGCTQVNKLHKSKSKHVRKHKQQSQHVDGGLFTNWSEPLLSGGAPLSQSHGPCLSLLGPSLLSQFIGDTLPTETCDTCSTR